MTFNEAAMFVLVMFFGAIPVGAVIFAGGVALSFLANAKPISERENIDTMPVKAAVKI